MDTLRTLSAAFALAAGMSDLAQAADPACLTWTENMHMTRSVQGVLLVEMKTHCGPFTYTAKAHQDFVAAFCHISHDRDNKIVIVAGAGAGFDHSRSGTRWSSIPVLARASKGQRTRPGQAGESRQKTSQRPT